MSSQGSGANRRMTNAFIPEDRRRALASHRTLPAHTYGSALFADISGFTPLTEALARQLGQRRGAEVLTQQLNQVYSALISAVEAANGSVIGFSGDAITCWFDESETEELTSQNTSQNTNQENRLAARAAVACAFAMQRAMAHFAELTLPGGVRARLGLKTAIVTGAASRLLVGEPGIQLIDVLAGSTLDALADAEHSAQQGDVVVDAGPWLRWTRLRGYRNGVPLQRARSWQCWRSRSLVSPGSTAKPPGPIPYWTTV